MTVWLGRATNFSWTFIGDDLLHQPDPLLWCTDAHKKVQQLRSRCGGEGKKVNKLIISLPVLSLAHNTDKMCIKCNKNTLIEWEINISHRHRGLGRLRRDIGEGGLERRWGEDKRGGNKECRRAGGVFDLNESAELAAYREVRWERCASASKRSVYMLCVHACRLFVVRAVFDTVNIIVDTSRNRQMEHYSRKLP